MTHRTWLAGLVATQLACTAQSTVPSVFDGSGGTWIDLTHTLSAEAVFWPTAERFRLDTVAYGRTDGGYFYAAYNFSAAEHGGTHLDAPIHFAEDRATADVIPIERFIGSAVVLDVSAAAAADRDYRVRPEDLEAWESRHGAIPTESILLVRTGWSDRWPDPVRYLGTDLTGSEAVPALHFPGIGIEAARWLVDRGVAAVGIDTPSIDYGQSTDFASHVALYSANIPGFENVTRLEALPETGSYVVALPTKIGGGSGAPLRIVAFVPKG